MLKLNPEGYAHALRRCYTTKDGRLIMGAPGIGKSEIPREVFQQIAKSKSKEFVLWDKASRKEKLLMFEKPELYFVFCDQRLSQMDTTDLRGIPKMAGDSMDTMPPMWVTYFTQSDADGVIFFDEINLAPPIVMGSAYQIIHDRSIADRKISDSVMMMAAGNRSEDKAFTFEMPLPLRDRFCEGELKLDAESWITWAAKNKINPHFIAFVKWKESYLYNISKDGADKSTTPRGIVRAARMLGSLPITHKDAYTYISLSAGEAFATEFQAYAKYYSQLDWGTIFSDPESVKGMDVSKNFAVAGGLAEHFQKDLNKFNDICNVIQFMPEEFGVMTLRFMLEGNKTSFKRRAPGSKVFQNVLGPKLGKFIVD